MNLLGKPKQIIIFKGEQKSKWTVPVVALHKMKVFLKVY